MAMTREQALNAVLFEEAMRQELEFRNLEFAAVRARDYDAANQYHEHRWRLLTTAVGILADLKDMGHA